jgi:hypothetical protein
MDVIFRMFIISFLIEVQPLPPHRQRLPEGDEGYVHIPSLVTTHRVCNYVVS